MLIFGIDTGTRTGWSFYDSKKQKVIESGVMDFSKKRGESNGMMFLRFRKWLRDMILDYGPGLIAYEQAHHRGGAATEIGVNLTGRVQEVAEEYVVPCATVHTATLKKFATGKGNAGKLAMIEAAKSFLGREPIDDNEADAVHISRWAAEEYA